MESIKEKLRLKMQQKKDQKAAPSTSTEEQQVEKLNIFKEKKYLEEKERQSSLLEQTKNEIEQLTQQVNSPETEEKSKQKMDIELELKKCQVLIKETTLDLNLEIQQIWSNFKVRENFTDLDFKKKFFLDQVEQFDREILYNYMYKSAQYEAFQQISVDRWKLFKSIFSKNQLKEIANNNKLYIRYLILQEYSVDFEKRFSQGNLNWRSEFKETNNLIDNLLGFKTFVDEEDLTDILKKKLIKKDKQEVQVLLEGQRRTRAIEWTPEEKFYLKELLETAEVQKINVFNTKKSPMVMIMIGHVDSGKSTISGQLLIQAGVINEMEVQKLKQEAEAKGRAGWWAAYLMDQDEEEREKAITIEVGKAYFETEKRRFTVLDCPGHKNYIQNMIEGAGQADLAVLVISARTGEFEAGFEKTGQTREHAMLARALGAERIIVCVNKMDFCSWSQERYQTIKDQMFGFLRKSCGFESDKILFVGVEGLSGNNVKAELHQENNEWYKDGTLFEALDKVQTIERTQANVLRIPVLTKQQNGADIELFGKVECGVVKQGMKCTLLPTQEKITIHQILNENEKEVYFAQAGESVKILIRNSNFDDIRRGDVICGGQYWAMECQEFVARLNLFDIPQEILISKGFEFTLHMHAIVEEGEIVHIIEKESNDLSSGTIQMIKKPKLLKSLDNAKIVIKMKRPICLEKFENVHELGRFSIRHNQFTIGKGEVEMIKPLNKELLKNNYLFKKA